MYRVCRLVAMHFIPNPLNKPEVNHLGAKTDDRAWMLEWVTKVENMQHAHANNIQYKRVAVVATDEDGEEVAYESIKDAADAMESSSTSITKCCDGIRGSFRGFAWRYAVDKPIETENSNEIWLSTRDCADADLQQFDYLVSNIGRVRSRHDKLLKPSQSYQVRLKNYPYKKTMYVHRLVLLTFDVPNPEKKPHVDHIDGDHTNNTLHNLRWTTYKENNSNPNTVRTVAIRGTHVETGEVKLYPSIKSAAEDGFTRSNISACLAGSKKTHRKYRWEYQI